MEAGFCFWDRINGWRDIWVGLGWRDIWVRLDQNLIKKSERAMRDNLC